MSDNKWENFKMKEKYYFISIDEIILLIIGVLTFSTANLQNYRLYFIGIVILWYWLKIRKVEAKIHLKKQQIYNIFYDNCGPIPQPIIDGKTKKSREPLNYELDQLEFQRKSLIDKFIVINLIIIVIIEIFIKT